ncbi:MAG: acyltransferase family protein [Saprospiraceae bacterium]|nr:acyltransferase family protein [Saprospiraceae bacterium]
MLSLLWLAWNVMSKTPLFWADRLRNLATLLVVVIHVAAPIAFEARDLNSSGWWWGNFWNSMARPAVPLFVMLSGFLLLGKDYELFGFLKRRVSRVVVPALFWMLIYSLYNHIIKGSPATPFELIKGIIEGPVHYHLWFIYLIIGLYLVYPILRPWVRSATERDYWYFFTMWAIGTWVYKAMYHFGGIDIGIYFELFTNNCGYFVLGYYLGRKPFGEVYSGHIAPWKISERQVTQLAWALITVGTLATMLTTYFFNTTFRPADGKFVEFFYDYLTPNVVISAVGWFLLSRQLFNSHPLLDIEREAAEASFGIYFVHVLAMDWLGFNGYWHSRIHPAFCIPSMVTLVFLVALTVIMIFRRLPTGERFT